MDRVEGSKGTPGGLLRIASERIAIYECFLNASSRPGGHSADHDESQVQVPPANHDYLIARDSLVCATTSGSPSPTLMLSLRS